jgi:hypothetical protein
MNLRLRCVLLAWAGASLLGVTGCDSVGIPESPRPTTTSDEKGKKTSEKSSNSQGPTKSAPRTRCRASCQSRPRAVDARWTAL